MVYSKKTLLVTLTILGLFWVTSVADGETVLLDFSSPYCGPCHQMQPVIRELKSQGYPIREIDVSRQPDLAANYRVQSVPCFILVVDGREVDRIVGTTNRGGLENMFRKVSDLPNGGHPTQPSPPVPRQPSTFATDGIQQVGGSAATEVNGLARSETPVSPAIYVPPSPAIHLPSGNGMDPLINASVRLRVDDAGGHSYGTGTIVHAQAGEAIILTCGHLFREAGGKGPVTVDLYRVAPAGSQQVGSFPGEVISYDLTCDVGLVRIRPAFPVCSIPVAPVDVNLRPGDPVVSVGCNHGQTPSAWDSRVTTIDRYDGPSNVEATRAPVEGRSGGGLFNSQGELIGVCFAADEQGNEGLYLGLVSIHEELRRNGIPSSGSMSPASRASGIPATLASDQSISNPTPPPAPSPILSNPIATPESGPSITGLESATNPVALNTASALDRNERATLQEIARRADGAEVTFIIRPNQVNAKSEIYTVDHASAAFVEHLIVAARTGMEPRRLTAGSMAAPISNPSDPSHPGRTIPLERSLRIREQPATYQGWSSVP
ncbi:MAG: trypsin-like peptidase domain-containing protein [Pirellulales bacterium]|nr:trypsin-like peptidase domain-containing protein [Pirellulales bacterium]